MIIGHEKMENSLLLLTNDLDNISQKFLEKLPKEEQKEFTKGIESIRTEMFKMLEAGKKMKEMAEKAYR